MDNIGATLGCMTGIGGFLIFSVAGISIWVSIVLVLFLTFLGLMFDSHRETKLTDEIRKTMDKLLKEVKDFHPTQTIIGSDLESVLLVDEKREKIVTIHNQHINEKILSKTYNKYDYVCREFTYEDVLQSEILEDNVTVTKTSRGSQVGGALLGGALFGGVGAVIGGLSATTTSQNKAQSVQLQIAVNDPKHTFHRVSFLSSEVPLEKSGVAYKQANELATHWNHLFKMIITNTDKKHGTNHSVVDEPFVRGESRRKEQSTQRPSSITEELKELHALLKEGILTEEEFNQQKKRLLS